MIDVSVCIVNWNTASLLVDCIQSLRTCADPDISIEVIVVDNASTDDSVGRVQARFPTVRLIANDKNVGFARANNQAIDVAQGRYVLLLNSDTEVRDETISRLVRFLDASPGFGAAGSMSVMPDGRLDLAARGVPTLGFVLCSLTGVNALFPRNPLARRYYLSDWDHRTSREVAKIHGACLMVRASILHQLGGFDPAYFMYGEDVDLCYRIGKLGWRIQYLADSVVVHHGGGSSRKNRRVAIKAHYESLFIFYRRHLAAWWTIPLDLLVFLVLQARMRVALLADGRHRGEGFGTDKTPHLADAPGEGL